MTLDPATKELIERLRQERDDARRDAAFVRQVAEAGAPALTPADAKPLSRSTEPTKVDESTAPLCTRCHNEPAVQGSPLGVRCLWPDLAAEVQAREAGPAYPQRQNPDATHREPRYGVEQRVRCPDVNDPRDWHGGWPSYREPWQAEDSRRQYEANDAERYEFRVVEFVPVVAHEECARCGTIGPVDVACAGCQGEIALETFPRSPRGSTDAAAPLPPKPCAQRHPDGERWCYLDEGHEGPHDAPAPRALPTIDHMPRRDR